MALNLARETDILPWTDDEFPRSNYAEVAPTPAVQPTASPAPAPQPAAAPALDLGSAGIERGVTRQPDRGEPSPVPATQGDPYKMKVMTPEERQKILKANAPQMSEDPLGAIAFVFQSIAAGMNGRELPADRLMKQYREQEALQLQRATVGISLMQHAFDMGKKLPPEKRGEFIAGLEKQYGGVVPNLKDFLAPALAGGGGTPEQIAALGEHGPKLMSLAQGDFQEALKLASNHEFIKGLNVQADAQNTAMIPAKIGSTSRPTRRTPR
jgi:hypothetical protein